MRIGLSYHGGHPEYDAYPEALSRRAAALGIALGTSWLAGAQCETRLDLLGALDAIIFTGGADVEPHRYGFADPGGLCRTQPERDALEWEMLERLGERPLPILAICRGAQVLNVFRGGSLIPDLAEKNAVHQRAGEERREHEVRLAGGSLLRRITGSEGGAVNSSHHQAIDRLADGFRVSAVSPDGVIEAFEATGAGAGAMLLAVQWHPEALRPGHTFADPLFDALLQARLNVPRGTPGAGGQICSP